MALFGPAFDFMMAHEDSRRAGTVTTDDGGLTRWGISQRQYPDLDIRNLAIEDAANLYREDYFKPIRGYDIRHQDIANKLFDMAVNMGIEQAVKLTQRACGDCGAVLVADGKTGPLTLAAINAADPTLLLPAMRSRAEGFYRKIAAESGKERFLKGWLRRANA